VVQNRSTQEVEINHSLFPEQTIIHLPQLPRSVEPIERIKCAADLLFTFEKLISNCR